MLDELEYKTTLIRRNLDFYYCDFYHSRDFSHAWSNNWFKQTFFGNIFARKCFDCCRYVHLQESYVEGQVNIWDVEFELCYNRQWIKR